MSAAGRIVLHSTFITLLVLSVSWVSPTFGATTTPLPYTVRTRPYDGWSSSVRGDIRTLGLAGATVGLADTYIASIDNPAGLAMTMEGIGLQISGNQIQDGYLQEFDQSFRSRQIGGTGSAYPWGFSLGWFTPHQESQNYSIGGGPPVFLETVTRLFAVSAARVFANNRFSVGASLIFGQGEETVGTSTVSSFALGGNIGAMYRFDSKWLLGASYGTSMHYAGDTNLNPSDGPAAFYQPIESPWRATVGAGYIPNRFFRFGFGFYGVGPIQDAALLSNQNTSVGKHFTLSPRMGTDYLLTEFKEFRARAGLGTYFETSRIEGTPNRLHATGGVDFKVWIFDLGWGIDYARDYRNYITSLGVDVIKLMRKTGLIPPDAGPPSAGFFPPPFHQSDDGLPRALVKEWHNSYPQPDIIDIGLGIPKRAQDQLYKMRSTLMDAVQKDPELYDEPLQSEPKPKRKKATGASPNR